MKKFGLVLSQRSTWLGIVTFSGAIGASFSPEQASAIAETGASIFGLILMFWKD
jgi:hypothetical protein